MDKKIPILPQEVEEGNIEYKRKVSFLNHDKFNKFRTQLIWRLDEGKKLSGNEEAVYYIGIEDNGAISGENIENIEKSINNFNKVTSSCNVEIYSTQIKNTADGIYTILKIRRFSNNYFENDTKIALLGASNNGKSTFLGILTYDILDDGIGISRDNIFRHTHEKQNGNTSSIKYEIIGYNENRYINYNSGYIGSWEYIVKNSKKIINLIDLPGNSKYLKTILFGLMAHRPDYVLIFISLIEYNEKNEIDLDTELYINLCIKLGLRFSLVFTKNDLINSDNKDDIIDKFCSKINLDNNIIYQVKDENDLNIIGNIDNIIPLFNISNVTGNNIDLIKFQLKNLNKYPNVKTFKDENGVEFMINDLFFVPDVGNVVSGILDEGVIHIGDKLLIGPLNQTFYNVKIVSIHKKQVPSKTLFQGEIGSLVIKIDHKLTINKHLMIISTDKLFHLKNKFKIKIKKDNYTELKKDLQLMVFCRNVYDSITINEIIDDHLDVTIDVKFHNENLQFIKNNEYVVIRYNNNIIVGNVII